MKNKYVSPQAEVIMLDTTDIITTSPGDQNHTYDELPDQWIED